MKHVSEHFIRSGDFRPKIEEVKYTRITFTLPEHLGSVPINFFT